MIDDEWMIDDDDWWTVLQGIISLFLSILQIYNTFFHTLHHTLQHTLQHTL